MCTNLDFIMKKLKKTERVIIVGAGNRGKELLKHLQENDAAYLECFFDNDTTKTGKLINGVEIRKPYRAKEKDILYILAIDSIQIRNDLQKQLEELGIRTANMLMYYCRDYEYMSTLDEKFYPEEIQEMYYEFFDKKMNWQNPVTYNEKINWEKINIRDERRTRLADKLLVKDWVREQIGEKYVTKLYGVWDNVEEIEFDSLPNAFALKLNNGSGRNIIVKDKSQMNWDETRKKLNIWLKQKYGYTTLELHYNDIIPKIICEEYLDGVAENVYDYNIYCFHGEPAYIWCIKGSHRPGCKASFYTKRWEMLPFSFGYPRDNILAPRPEKLDEMLELSRILCKDFKHVRVDWYNLPDGRVLFGEMTFATWAGLAKWEPEEYDIIFGNMI